MYNNYYIDEIDNGKVNLVKVLNEYDNKEEAKKDLFKLVTNNKTEKDLLKEYSKKEIL